MAAEDVKGAQEAAPSEDAGAQEPKPRTRRKMTEEQKAAALAKRRATLAAKKAAAEAAAASAASAEAGAAQEAPAEEKRSAGRRKAATAGEEPAKEAAAPATQAEEAAASEGQAPAAEAAAPKRRGRPRLSEEEKARRAAERAAKKAEQAKREEQAASSESAVAVEGEPSAAAFASAEGAETAAAANAPDAEQPAKSKRRNNRRKKRGDSAEASQSADGTEQPKAAEGDQPAEAAESGAESGTEPAEAEKQAEDKGAAGDKGADDRNDRSGRRNNRRKRRNGKDRREIAPSATRDELATLADEELVAKAEGLNVDPAEYGERDDLVSAVYDALLQAEGFVMVDGILDLMPDGYGFIRTNGYLAGEHDVYVGASMVRRNGLRRGDYIAGRVRPARENEKFPALNMIVTLNGEAFEGPTHRVKFSNLTPVYPDERLVMEHGSSALTARAIDLVAPIGKGQRGLIVSPPKAGKTTVLKDIAAAISANNPEVHLMCLLVDERPEEVTDMERSIDGEVISSTFDMPCENHIAVAELVIERAKRLVEQGQDVVILLDSITRLARAYNLGTPASGRILSGGVDSGALYPPKRFLGAARNIENGGSLTILGTALVDTGSKMDEVIFEEFKGTGNMELKLDRQLADRRIFPAIDPVTSGTRKEELLLDPQEAPLVWGLRRILANMNNTERAMDMLVKSLKQTDTNREFLIKSAKKAAKTNVGASL
ncbi:MAG: transcription termination factor Rho [Coriobacteriales bacterium]